MTSFYEIYDFFLNSTIDEEFIDYEDGKIDYEELQPLLLSAIIAFKHSKVDIRDYDLDYEDEHNVKGKFNNELSLEEIELLSSYMSIRWAENKLKRSRLTQLQYTGSDAKVINIKTHIEAIKEIIKTLKEQNRELNNNYQNHVDNKLSLHKKNSIRKNTIYQRR